MFREGITSPLVSGVGASSLFKNISSVGGGGIATDESFLSSLRALLYPRVKGNPVNLIQRQVQIRSMKDEQMDEPDKDSLSVLYFRQSINTEVKETLVKEFESGVISWPGWECVKNVTIFYAKQAPVYCYINRGKRAAVVFVLSRPDRQLIHYLQAAIPAYLPWYFSREEGVTELERRMVDSLRENTPDKYLACMEEFAELYHLRDEGIRALVGDIESRYEKHEAERLKEKIKDLMEEVRANEDRIRDLLRTKRDDDIRLNGLLNRQKDRAAESPLVGYFINNRKAEVVGSDDDSITVVVRETCSIFDESEAEYSINDRRSLVYSIGDGELNDDDMELLMRAIFLDKELQINFCSAYKLYLYGGVDGLRRYEFGPKYADCMPNPHIEHYACTGDYGEAIREALTDGDMIGGIEMAIASCASLNFSDGAVMEEFINDLQGEGHSNNRCIVLPDGSVVTPSEAVRYLRKE